MKADSPTIVIVVDARRLRRRRRRRSGDKAARRRSVRSVDPTERKRKSNSSSRHGKSSKSIASEISRRIGMHLGVRVLRKGNGDVGLVELKNEHFTTLSNGDKRMIFVVGEHSIGGNIFKGKNKKGEDSMRFAKV